MTKQSLTQERLKELLDYDPKTGVFIWKKNRGGTARIGSIAGTPHNCGYSQINVSGSLYLAHRLAFLYMTGEFPEHEVDHINHIRNDNCWNNLREATHINNTRNQEMRVTNTSGVTGVYWDKAKNKHFAAIKVAGSFVFLGYGDFEKVCLLRKEAEIKFLFHGNHGLKKHVKKSLRRSKCCFKENTDC